MTAVLVLVPVLALALGLTMLGTWPAIQISICGSMPMPFLVHICLLFFLHFKLDVPLAEYALSRCSGYPLFRVLSSIRFCLEVRPFGLFPTSSSACFLHTVSCCSLKNTSSDYDLLPFSGIIAAMLKSCSFGLTKVIPPGIH